MNTLERFKLYIDKAGRLILAHKEGFYTLGFSQEAATTLSYAVMNKRLDYELDDYDDTFCPAA